MEEDINILERFLKICDEDLFTEISIKTSGLTRNAIEHLIRAYKVKEENNNILRQQNITYKNNIYDLKHNNIPVSLVEEKIEELKNRIEKYREYAEQGIETDVEWVDNVADRETVKVLQELLEKR